jgi:hypothetical protein
MSLKKEKNQANSGKTPKPWLISKTCNSWNPRLELDYEAQFSTNLILNNENMKKSILKKI